MFRATSRLASRTHFWKLVGALWSFLGPLGHLLDSSSAPLPPLGSSVSTLGQHVVPFIVFWVVSGQPWRHKRVLQPPTRPPKTPKVSFLLMFNNGFEYKYTKRVYTRTISRNRGYEKSRGNLNKPTGLARQLQTTCFAVAFSPKQDSQQHGANLSEQLYTTQQHFDTAQRPLKTALKNSGAALG